MDSDMLAASRQAFAGSLVALITPFRDGHVDEACLVQLVERQVARGTRAIVVCGSTGEAPALQAGEHAAVIRIAVGAAGRHMPVIAGCGAPATQAAAELAAVAAHQGAAGLLCAPPPYVKPTQEGIVAHVRAVAHASDLPVILYDVPSRTGVAIRDETIAQLFERGWIAGVKDATADLARPPRLAALCGPALIQLTGDDATSGAYRAAGGHGCISVTANVVPALCSRLHRSWESGRLAAFAEARDALAPVSDVLFAESNPIPVKAALALLHLTTGDLRLPLTRACRTTRDRLADVLARVLSAEEAIAARSRYALVG